MDLEQINEGSTDIWLSNVIEKYEQRPSDLKEITLANFVANYYKIKKEFIKNDYYLK